METKIETKKIGMRDIMPKGHWMHDYYWMIDYNYREIDEKDES